MVEPHRGAMPPQSGRDRLGARGRVALVVFSGAAAYFLWMEHRAHVIQLLPWGILALCPLVHIFMHRGHGDHGAHGSSARGGRDGDGR